VGFLAYEYVHRLEPSVPRPGPERADTPVLCFLFIDEVVVFDRARQTLLLCACAHLAEGEDPLLAYDRALARIRTLHDQLDRPAPAPLPAVPEVPVPGLPPSNFERPAFEQAVAEAREYVHAGDVVQVVLSQRFERAYTRPPMDLYRALRTVNPSPYMVLFETEELAIVGASPEVHVRLTGDRVEIRPIAGTRPRGADEEEDHAHEEDLLADPKERAEHLMLVDLARNDIGRVCAPGSVHVPEFMGIERYSHVMHIVSQVEGTLAPGRNAFDLMRATFPAGTVSGAPKVRALQIIAEKEPGPRGPYSGALGYFAYGGNHDSCIAIRSAVLRDGRIRVQAGAGIVADSIPESEWQETVNKARGLLKAVALSEIVES
jgi:anthranilate synthase component 1